MGEGWVLGLVLLSALLHASWNALTRRSVDPLLAIWLVTLVCGGVAALATPLVSFPRREAWPYLAGSVVLHLAYQFFLAHAYRVGDLSQVYPIARGMAPCVVAALAAALAGERPGAAQLAGLALISGSIAGLALGGVRHAGRGGRAVRAAALTGLLIGAYTFVDASGVRAAGRPFDYIAWVLFLDSIPMSILALLLRGREALAFLRAEIGYGLVGGIMAAVGYGIVMWAMSRAPMAGVAALRETSVIFAAWIGTRLLGEPFGARRIAAATGVAAGIVLLRG
jgi:drug/metabolite transporter (DMT)-like permease